MSRLDSGSPSIVGLVVNFPVEVALSSTPPPSARPVLDAWLRCARSRIELMERELGNAG